MLTRALAAVATCGALVAAGGCGSSSESTVKAPRSHAAPLSAIDPRADRAVVITPAVYTHPIALYKRHIRRQLEAMLGDARTLRATTARDDLSGARDAWLRAEAHYERIGAAYGAFGDLDAAINGLPGGLQGGTASPDFTGLHRIELALFKRRSTGDAAPYARQLVTDVAKLRAAIPKAKIEPLDFGLRAHEVLEDTLQLELAGVASPYSGAALTALDANIDGTRVVMASMGPIAARTNRLAVLLANRALDRLDHAVDALRRHGRFPRWDAVSQIDRERIDGLTAAAAERLAYMPGLVDPRPPRPIQRPIEVSPR